MFEYQGFATLGVNLNRQKYGPLDISNVFTSLADLNYYLSKGENKEGVSDYWKNTVPYPYAGQYVALVDNTTRTVTPYMLSEKADGTFETIKVGAPEVDGETIIVNEAGKLEAVIPEYTDTNTTYKLSVTATEEGEAVQGVKITLTPYDGETAGTPQSFVIADPDLSDYITTSELNAELAKKANATEVYTKTETDTKIGQAVAAADHLKRKIVEAPGEGETIEDVIDKTADDADQYIYMVPTGLQESDNKYREYIVIIDEATGSRYIEQVGNWEVDLSGYLTIASANETYAKKNEVASTYATKSEVATTLEGYVTDQELSTTLNGYATKSEIPTDYVSDSEFATELAKYDTITVADGKYAAKDNTYTKEEVDDLLEDKVDVSTATSDNGIRFINQTEINKLSKLNLDGEDITISGSVNASQVKDLYSTVTSIVKGSAADLDPEMEGNQLGLGIEEGAQVNKINTVSDEFDLTNTHLSIKDGGIAIAKVATLQDTLNDKATVGQLEAVDGRLEAVEGILNDTFNEDGTTTFGLVTKVATLTDTVNSNTSRITVLETAVKWQNI